MLSCKDVSQLVSESLDRRLTWRQRMGLWMHFSMCGLCKRFRREMVALHDQLQETPEPPDSSEIARDVQLSVDARSRIEAALSNQDH